MAQKGKHCFLQFLGTQTGDSTPTLLLFFNSKRYLFNCGEGTQRFCIEKKVKLARVHGIFLTRLKWEQIGGLPGPESFLFKFVLNFV
jgi:ribonuclease Z